MGSGAENIYPLPPPVLLPLGEAAPRTPGAGPGRPRGGGHSAGPGPSARARQLWGAACDPCPRVWGRAEGPRREERLQTLRGGEEGGGGGRSCSSPRGAPSPTGRAVRGAAGRAGRARHCPTAAPHRRGPPATAPGGTPRGGKTSRPPPWESLCREGGAGGGSGVLGRIQSKAKERELPAPAIHLLKSGDTRLTKHGVIQAFVQNILIKILSDIDTHTNDRTLLS